MRDALQPFRWSDLTNIVGPSLLSLLLAILALLHRPSDAVLEGMLGAILLSMALAAALPAAAAAERLRTWRARGAPTSAATQVNMQWRRQVAWVLVLGGFGPLLMAGRLGLDGNAVMACWMLQVPLLGFALGTFGGWAWLGHAGRAWLGVWSVLPLGIALTVWGWPQWLRAPWLVLMVALTAAVFFAATWRQALALRPVWRGVRHPARGPSAPRTPKLARTRLVTLAFDSAAQNEAAGYWPRISSQFNWLVMFSIMGPRLIPQIAYGEALDGWRPWVLCIWALWLGTMLSTGLVFREQHWRLRLAPGGHSPRRRALTMLVASMAQWLAALLAGVLLAIWGSHGQLQVRLDLYWLPMVADVLLGLGYVAWLRGLSNRGPRVFFGVLGLALGLAAVASVFSAFGMPLVRGAWWVGAELLFTAVLYAAAARLWSQRAMSGPGVKRPGSAT